MDARESQPGGLDKCKAPLGVSQRNSGAGRFPADISRKISRGRSIPEMDGLRFATIAIVILLAVSAYGIPGHNSWTGVLRDSGGNAVPEAVVELHAMAGGAGYSARTSASGAFVFPEI